MKLEPIAHTFRYGEHIWQVTRCRFETENRSVYYEWRPLLLGEDKPLSRYRTIRMAKDAIIEYEKNHTV